MKRVLHTISSVVIFLISAHFLTAQQAKLVPLSDFNYSFEGPSGAIAAGDVVIFTFSLNSAGQSISGWEPVRLKFTNKAKFPVSAADLNYQADGWLSSSDPTALETDIVLDPASREVLLYAERIDGVAGSGTGMLFTIAIRADQNVSSAAELVEVGGGHISHIIYEQFKQNDSLTSLNNFRIFPTIITENKGLNILLSFSPRSVKIVNEIGAICYSSYKLPQKDLILDLNGYQSGYYVVVVESNAGQVTTKKVLVL